MSRRPRIAFVIAFGISLTSIRASAQAPTPGRRPFAKPGASKKVERVRTFDVLNIKGMLTLDIAKAEIRGTVTHTLVPLHPGLESIVLDCGPDLKVSRVAIGPKDCAFTRKGDSLAITLDRPYATTEPVDVAVTYSGSPERGVRFVKPDPDVPGQGPSVWTVAEPDDARAWLPCYDAPNERSTAEMVITVAKPLSVVSNGTLVSTRDNGDGTATYHWKMESNLPTYLISVVAADFNVYRDKVGSLPVEYYVVKPVDEATARRAMGKTPRMIEFFNKAIGTPYAYPKYAQACLPEFGGGMEHTSATTLTDSILKDATSYLERDADSLVAHELAHQWFGDLLTCRDWSNLWLNEGFASYFDAVYAEHAKGDDAFRLVMANDLSAYLGSDSQVRRPIVEAGYDDPWQMFDAVTYSKGACVLHALRGTIGDAAWWRGIAGYVASNRDRTVVTDDFRKAMEAASNRDLGWFFDQWVSKAGHPELTVRWRYEDEDGTLRLQVDQTQAVDEMTPLFRLPTSVEIGDESGVRSVAIVIDGRSHEFVIPAPRRPKTVRIDPRGWLPKVVKFEKPAEEWAYQLEHATDVLGRVEAAKALAGPHKADPIAASALARAWKAEKAPEARAEVVKQVAALPGPCRDALLEAARDPEARVRVAAMIGLGSLKLDPAIEAADRSTLANPTEAYGVRTAALRGLVLGKVIDADALVANSLRDPANDHVLGRAALQLILDAGGRPAREAAVLYSRPGQPTSLRRIAIPALARLTKDDPEVESTLLGLLDDAHENIRLTAAMAVARGDNPSALPKLEAVHARSSGQGRRMLGGQIERLKEKAKPKPVEAKPEAATETNEANTLERQAAEFELQAKELRNRAEALRLKVERARLGTAKPPG